MVLNENLRKLKVLIDEIEDEKYGDNNHQVLEKIESIIEDEKNKISSIKKTENKLKHYEIICSSILSIISATKF